MKIERLIKEAEYADIIISLLQPPYNISSLCKMTFIAFCVQHEQNISAYTKRTRDFVDTFFNNISLKLLAHSEDIEVIFRVISILENNNIITLSKDDICVNVCPQHKTENAFLKFCEHKTPNPITEIDKLDIKALLEEVIRYV